MLLSTWFVVVCVYALAQITTAQNTWWFFHFTDLVLKDKIIVYDLAHQRIGWANYDCKFSWFQILIYDFFPFSAKEITLTLYLWHIYELLFFRFLVCKCLYNFWEGVSQCRTAECEQWTDTYKHYGSPNANVTVKAVPIW